MSYLDRHCAPPADSPELETAGMRRNLYILALQRVDGRLRVLTPAVVVQY